MLYIVLVLLSSLVTSEAGKILILNTVTSPSHSFWFNELGKALLEHGHQITMLDTLPSRYQHSNLTHLVVDRAYEFDDNFLADLDFLSSHTSLKFCADLLYEYTNILSKKTFSSETVQSFLLNNRHRRPFDLIIQDATSGEAITGFVHELGYPPLILASAAGAMHNLLYISGNYYNPFYYPKHGTPFTAPMGFRQKLENLFFVLYQTYLDNIKVREAQNQISKAFFGESIPPVEELQDKAGLFFFNSHYLIDGLVPQPPSVVTLAGLHIQPERKTLPKEIEEFLDGGKEGVIYFSFGSNIMASDMTEEKRAIFLDVFREIPQRILWKWNAPSLPGQPENVMISQWFNQQDVLSHKNVRAFISHGGLLGTLESIYHGVPMLVIPFLCDQFTTAERLQHHGVALSLDFRTITQAKLKNALDQLLTNQSFEAKMGSWSKIMKDEPQKAREKAVYWVEYALRLKDLSHLRSPTRDMRVYEILLLDVLGALLCILVMPVLLLFIGARILRSKHVTRKIKTN